MSQGERPQMGSGDSQATSMEMVWLKKNGNLVPCPVKTGMSDGAYKIIEQGLHEGDSVVLSAQYVVKEKTKKTGENPFMPGPPGRNKNKGNNKGGGAPSGPPQ